MTRLFYTITTPDNKTFTANTYAEALQIKGGYTGAKMTTCYEPISEPTHTTPKQLAMRVKAY